MDFTKPVKLYNVAKVAKVTKRKRSNFVATLTTSVAHGFSVGDPVIIDSVSSGIFDTGGNINYDGRYVVKAIPTSTTFTYDNVGYNEAEQNVAAGVATKLDTINLNELADVRGGPRTVTGYKLEQVNYNLANIEGYVDKRALRDGLDYTEPFLSARTIQLQVGIFGETLGDFWDLADKLSKGLAPNAPGFERDYGVRPFRFFQPTRVLYADFPTGIEMEIGVRPTTLVQYTVNRSMSTGLEANGFAQRVAANLMMPDPKKYNVSKRIVGTHKNRGSVPSFATIRGSGQSNTTKVVVSWTSGGKTSIVTLLVGSGHWSIEMDRVTSIGNVKIVHQETSGDFMVYPGDTVINSITKTASAGATAPFRTTPPAGAPSDPTNAATDPDSVTVEFYEAWL